MTAWSELRDRAAGGRDRDLALLTVRTPAWVAYADSTARPGALVAANEAFTLRAVLDGPDVVRDAGAVLAPLVAGVIANLDPAPAAPELDLLSVLALESAIACAGGPPDDDARRRRVLGAYADATSTPLVVQRALVAAAGAGARDAGERLAAVAGTPAPGTLEDVAGRVLAATTEPAARDTALAAWHDFRDAFPRMRADGSVSWGELLWLARGALHLLGGVPVASVVDALRAEVLP